MSLCHAVTMNNTHTSRRKIKAVAHTHTCGHVRHVPHAARDGSLCHARQAGTRRERGKRCLCHRQDQRWQTGCAAVRYSPGRVVELRIADCRLQLTAWAHTRHHHCPRRPMPTSSTDPGASPGTRTHTLPRPHAKSDARTHARATSIAVRRVQLCARDLPVVGARHLSGLEVGVFGHVEALGRETGPTVRELTHG